MDTRKHLGQSLQNSLGKLLLVNSPQSFMVLGTSWTFPSAGDSSHLASGTFCILLRLIVQVDQREEAS